MSANEAKCELCGEPMPAGEEIFNYHGYSGPCPKPPLPKVERAESGVQWHVGSKIYINVYEGDRLVCQCHTAADANRIVEAMNKEIAKVNNNEK
jgi:hypothetical protein